MEENIIQDILNIIEKFSGEGHNNTITIGDGEKLHRIARSTINNEMTFPYLCDRIKDIYEQGNFSEHSILYSIFGNLMRGNENLKEQIIQFVIKLLNDENPNLIVFGMQIYRFNQLFESIEPAQQFILRLMEFWDNINLDLKCASLWAVESRPALIHFDIYINKFKILKNFVQEGRNNCIKAYSMAIIGDIYLESHRRASPLLLSKGEIDEFLVSYRSLSEVNSKIKFLDGISWIFLKSPLYHESWLDFLISEYNNTDNISLKSQILRVIAYFPNNKNLDEINSDKYEEFFRRRLNDLFENDYEKPIDSVIVRANILQDTITWLEQLVFKLPLVVERLLPLYEQVFKKYIPTLRDNRPGFDGIAWQKLHSIYVKLVEYYRDRSNSEKLHSYSSRLVELSFSEQEKLEFKIKSLIHQIIIRINSSDFNTSKGLFPQLHLILIEYKEKIGNQHSCVPVWTIIEDTIYLITSTPESCAREYKRYNDHVQQFNDQLPDELKLIFNEIGNYQSDIMRLETASSYTECGRLAIQIHAKIQPLIEKSLEIENEFIKSVIETINKAEQRRVDEVRTRKATEILYKYRKKFGFPEVNEESYNYWMRLIEFISNLDLKEFPRECFNEEDDFNDLFCIKLNDNFPNIIINKTISGRIHVDLADGSIIAIEVKKLENNTAKDEWKGQLIEDLRIGSFHYGLGFGIDISKNKELCRYNEITFRDSPNLFFFVKAHPYTD